MALKVKGCRQGCSKTLGPPQRHAAIGPAYVMSKKEAATYSTVVTGTLFLNSKPFCALCDSFGCFAFVYIYPICHAIELQGRGMETNYKIIL